MNLNFKEIIILKRKKKRKIKLVIWFDFTE